MTTWRKAEPEAAGSRKPSCDPSGSSPTRPPPAGALRTSASRPGDTWMQALCPSHAAQTSGAVATRGCWLGGISRLGRASTRQQHCSTPFRLFTAPQAAICGRVDEDERAAEWETGKGSRPAAPRITCSWSTGAITSESSNNLFQLLGAFSHGISFVLSRPDGGRLDLRPSGITSIRLAHWRLALEHLSGQPQPTQGAASESRGAEARDRPLEHLLGQP